MTTNPAPRPDLVPTSSQHLFTPNDAKTGFPHDSTSSPRPRPMSGRGRGRSGNLVPTSSQVTTKFTANTCPKCHHITIAGITDFGFTLHLEPLQLTDFDEAQAIAHLVPTYNLYPDRIVRLRWLTHIRHPTTAPRHARHVCGTTHGTRTSPAPARTRAALSDTPPF